ADMLLTYKRGTSTSAISASSTTAWAATLLNDGSGLVTRGAPVIAGPFFCPAVGPALASIEIYTPPAATRLPTSCQVTLAGTIRVAMRSFVSPRVTSAAVCNLSRCFRRRTQPLPCPSSHPRRGSGHRHGHQD